MDNTAPESTSTDANVCGVKADNVQVPLDVFESSGGDKHPYARQEDAENEHGHIEVIVKVPWPDVHHKLQKRLLYMCDIHQPDDW